MFIIQFILLFLPLLTLAQNSSSGQQSQSASVSNPSSSGSRQSTSNGPTSTQFTTVVSTFLSTSVGFASGSRQETTVVLSSVISTVIPVLTQSNSDNTPTTSSTPTVSLPPKSSAPAIDGGGYNSGSGAPLPGAKSPNGVFGPDDNYIAAATALARNAFTVTIIASLIASAVLVL